ncbi:MAG: hypothetical protein WBA22_09895 [Candidatus Methanofastidiosia archaeon]
MNALDKKPSGFKVIDPRKILFHWACIRATLAVTNITYFMPMVITSFTSIGLRLLALDYINMPGTEKTPMHRE